MSVIYTKSYKKCDKCGKTELMSVANDTSRGWWTIKTFDSLYIGRGIAYVELDFCYDCYCEFIKEFGRRLPDNPQRKHPEYNSAWWFDEQE